MASDRLGLRQPRVRVRINLALDPALVRAGKHKVGRLGFQTISDGHSMIVPLLLSQPSGTMVGAKAVAKTQVDSGRVIIVDGAPVLTVGTPP